jgi:membrane protease YdiL (CAAX protease family)
VIWGIWHLPLFFVQGLDQFGQSFPIFALGTTALSVAMTWLYTRTNGNLFLMMIMHSAVNQTVGIIPQRASEGSPFTLHASTVSFLTLLLLWIAAGYFLKRMAQP